MKQVKLTTIHDDGTQRMGVLSVIENNKLIFLCKTLELPYNENQNGISAIPKGEYNCVFTMSSRFKKKMYLVDGVPGRAGIRIHPANYARQLQGCIALGSIAKDLDKDGNLDIIHSGDTCKEFEAFMEWKPFRLTIC